MKTLSLISLTDSQLHALDALADKLCPVETVKNPRRGYKFRANGRGFFYWHDANAEARKVTLRQIRTVTELA